MDDKHALGPEDWLYFKLYLGHAVEKIDHLIIELLPAILAHGGFERWFFLRYLDQQGVHVRLRLRASPGQAAELSAALRKICSKKLERLPQLPPPFYRPMVLPTGFNPDDKGSPRSSGIRLDTDTYEPEFDKFGGAAGILIAEEVFETSSRIALTILQDEFDGKYSRKTIAPCLMESARSIFPMESPPQSFWRDYSIYWLGGYTTAATDWRERFLAKGQSLHEQGEQVVPASPELPAEATALVERWRACLQPAAAAYARIAGLDQTNQTLAVNFIHLMNNRLGFMSLEESYLGVLLEQRAERGG